MWKKFMSNNKIFGLWHTEIGNQKFDENWFIHERLNNC